MIRRAGDSLALRCPFPTWNESMLYQGMYYTYDAGLVVKKFAARQNKGKKLSISLRLHGSNRVCWVIFHNAVSIDNHTRGK